LAPDFFESEIIVSQTDALLNYLSDYNLLDNEALKTLIPKNKLYDTVYLKRVKQLNEMKMNLAQLKRIRN